MTSIVQLLFLTLTTYLQLGIGSGQTFFKSPAFANTQTLYVIFMKQSFLIFITIFLSKSLTFCQMSAPTQHLLPNRAILETTFNIFYSSMNGTAFVVNGKKGQYLVTAKHLFGTTLIADTLVEIQIKGGKIDKKLQCKVYYHDNPYVDIAVLILDTAVIAGEILPLGKPSQYFLAQECLFLGFPLFNLGTQTEIGKVPLVKKAIISAFHEENKVEWMLLDGHNNPGFSGGPVITYSENINKQFIIAIIGGYINQQQSVNITYGTVIDKIQINENSGIIISYGSDYIQQIIDKIESNIK
jgi:Trypsin-like peptidase domain